MTFDTVERKGQSDFCMRKTDRNTVIRVLSATDAL